MNINELLCLMSEVPSVPWQCPRLTKFRIRERRKRFKDPRPILDQVSNIHNIFQFCPGSIWQTQHCVESVLKIVTTICCKLKSRQWLHKDFESMLQRVVTDFYVSENWRSHYTFAEWIMMVWNIRNLSCVVGE